MQLLVSLGAFLVAACNIQAIAAQSCSPTNAFSRVVGYYELWAAERGCDAFTPDEIPLNVYTHINIAFASINQTSYEIQVAGLSSDDVAMYKRVTDLKKQNSTLKVFIAVGGGQFSKNAPTNVTFPQLVADPKKYQRFFTSLLNFMQMYNFDGVDLDWEYPGSLDRSGSGPAEKENFSKFVVALSVFLNTHGYPNSLSMAIPSPPYYLRTGYNFTELAQSVTWFNLMAYDLESDPSVPGAKAHTNLTAIDQNLSYLVGPTAEDPVDPSQLVLGIAFYGNTWTLQDPACQEPGCPVFPIYPLNASSPTPGPCSSDPGHLLISEIDADIPLKPLAPKLYPAAAVKVAVYDQNQWLAYDDADTFSLKSQYAHSKCLSGLMLYAVSKDTADAKYSEALGAVAWGGSS